MCQADDSVKGEAVSAAPLQSDGGAEAFKPDWRLDATGIVAVSLSISLAKHIPGWPGSTDEQLDAVAGDVASVVIAELKELTSLNRRLSKQLEHALRQIEETEGR